MANFSEKKEKKQKLAPIQFFFLHVFPLALTVNLVFWYSFKRKEETTEKQKRVNQSTKMAQVKFRNFNFYPATYRILEI
jgi:hypothetical protein